jgi:hypothetical protein
MLLVLEERESGREGGAGISPAWERGRVGVGGARYCELRDWREGLVRGMEGVLFAALVPSESGNEATPEMVLPVLRFLLRTVTEEGMTVAVTEGWWPRAEPERGEARGGVLTGPGSLERAVWTRASRFCIFERRLRRCMIEEDWGRPEERVRGLVRDCL